MSQVKQRYAPGPMPADGDAAVWNELRRISEALGQDNLRELQTVAPSSPVDGQLEYADGTNWNPGGGAGYYMRIGDVWVKFCAQQVISCGTASITISPTAATIV